MHSHDSPYGQTHTHTERRAWRARQQFIAIMDIFRERAFAFVSFDSNAKRQYREHSGAPFEPHGHTHTHTLAHTNI